MDKEIKKLEHCLKAMKRCLKIPNVEKCICFSDAFKALDLEASELYKKIEQISGLKNKEKLLLLRKEIGRIKKIISLGNKDCLGCSPCIASVVFKAYPDTLNNLYQDNNL